jgi:putative two-component system response regulator
VIFVTLLNLYPFLSICKDKRDIRMAAPDLFTLHANGEPHRAAEQTPAWDIELWDPENPPTVLILDDVNINRHVLRAMLRNSPYRILEARRASEALDLLNSEKIDLVILDLMMPEVGGPEFCRQMKSNKRTQLIPILMLTSVQGTENEITGIASGADEFLIKPVRPAVVRTRVQAMLRNKAAIDSLEEAETIVFALAQSVEHRDKYTGGHCQRLARYSVALGERLKLPRFQLLALYRGGFLHDIGKICVPDSILYHNGSLSPEQWTVMRSHTIVGEQICKGMKSLAPVLPIIRSHHERWDGSGYPDSLSGQDIPLLARILQLADIYDALTTKRPYKAAFKHEEAMDILNEEARRGWRDPELVAEFREVAGRFELEIPTEDELIETANMTLSLENMRRELAK